MRRPLADVTWRGPPLAKQLGAHGVEVIEVGADTLTRAELEPEARAPARYRVDRKERGEEHAIRRVGFGRVVCGIGIVDHGCQVRLSDRLA